MWCVFTLRQRRYLRKCVYACVRVCATKSWENRGTPSFDFILEFKYLLSMRSDADDLFLILLLFSYFVT